MGPFPWEWRKESHLLIQAVGEIYLHLNKGSLEQSENDQK